MTTLTPEPVRVTDKLRAEIAARDWDAVMVASDKSKPIDLPDRVRRLWRR